MTGGKAATAVKAVKKTEAAPKGEKKQQHCLTAMSSGLVHLATQVYSNPPGESTNDQVVKLLVCRVKQWIKYQEADVYSKQANWEELTKVV